jgi:uncharacterized protein YkwD
MKGPAPRNHPWVKGLAFSLLLIPALAEQAWEDLPPDEFGRRPELAQRIDLATFDRELMSAAIFHETNRVRGQLGLPAFTHLSKLDDAADLKAVIGAVQGGLVHENPLPLTGTPADRVRFTGLVYQEVAENIARVPVPDVPGSRTPVGRRQRDGRTEYYHLDTGRIVENRTYAQFAAVVVQAWMDSPPHRANILSRSLVSLGCAARPCPSPDGRHEQIYAVQVFFRPK